MYCFHSFSFTRRSLRFERVLTGMIFSRCSWVCPKPYGPYFLHGTPSPNTPYQSGTTYHKLYQLYIHGLSRSRYIPRTLTYESYSLTRQRNESRFTGRVKKKSVWTTSFRATRPNFIASPYLYFRYHPWQWFGMTEGDTIYRNVGPVSQRLVVTGGGDQNGGHKSYEPSVPTSRSRDHPLRVEWVLTESLDLSFPGVSHKRVWSEPSSDSRWLRTPGCRW